MLKTLVFLVGCYPSIFSMYNSEKSAFPWHEDIVAYNHIHENKNLNFVATRQLFDQEWNALPQPVFWQQIMAMSPDSVLINVASNRNILAKMSQKDWDKQSQEQKNNFKDSIKLAHGLSLEESIFVTGGKNHFYRFHDVIPHISRGVEVFAANLVDPWYAQAILLVESPGQLVKSNAGAYGPFQLMKSVAINQGLVVNKTVDERADFDKSAWAASQLLKNICVPEAIKILRARNIAFEETDLWFRLFVMHIYHAGAANVSKVIEAINPREGGQQLIQKMWQTKAGGFGNASQNYSQIVLAALLTLDKILNESPEFIVAENN
jgi:hypothetical protein